MTAPTPDPQPHQSAPLSARQAAAALGINEKTVRRRIERGELPATKSAAGAYQIEQSDLDRHRADHAAPVPHQDAAPAADTAAPSEPQAAPVSAPAAPVDLQPLADLIERQTGEIRRLSESATMWQIRAIQAEDKLKQLTATVEDVPARTEPQEAPPAPRSEEIAQNVTADTSRRPWWKLW